jgi:hypothetical protein
LDGSPTWRIGGGEIIFGRGGDLIVSRGPAHDLVGSLSAADLGRIKSAMLSERLWEGRVVEMTLKDGAVTLARRGEAFEVRAGQGTPDGLLGRVKPGEPGLRKVVVFKDDQADIRLNGETLVVRNPAGEVTAEAREVARVLRDKPELARYAGKLERVDGVRLKEVERVRASLRAQPVLRATLENGQVVVRDPKTGFDLREAVRAANEGRPLPARVKDFVGPGKAVDVSGLNARQLAGVRAQLRAIRKIEPEFTRLLDSGLEGSARRRADLLDWQTIEVGADASLGKVKKNGEIARSILDELSGDISGDRSIEFVIAHADGGGTYYNQAMRRAAGGEFRGKHVAAVLCELEPEQVLSLRDAVLKNGGLSFLSVDTTIDVPAATLAATRLRSNPEVVGAVTPADVPLAIYRDAAAALRRCDQAESKIEAIRREFGPKAGDFFLKGNGEVDGARIKQTIEALEKEWLLFIETVEATDAPRPAVAPAPSRPLAA